MIHTNSNIIYLFIFKLIKIISIHNKKIYNDMSIYYNLNDTNPHKHKILVNIIQLYLQVLIDLYKLDFINPKINIFKEKKILYKFIKLFYNIYKHKHKNSITKKIVIHLLQLVYHLENLIIL